VTRIANTVASIPVHVYKGRERQDTHPLEKLLNLSPNPSMSAYIFKQTWAHPRRVKYVQSRDFAQPVPDNQRIRHALRVAKKGRERQDTHPLEKLLNLSPNPSMSAYIFKQTMEAFRNTESNTRTRGLSLALFSLRKRLKSPMP